MAPAPRAIVLAILAGCAFDHGGSAPDDAHVGSDATADAGIDARSDAAVDAQIDAMTPNAAFVAATVDSAASASSLSYPFTIPAGSGRFLLVAVQLGTSCSVTVPSVTGVTYNGDALTQIKSIVGTPCGPSTTSSSQWQLVAPATGAHDVVITLSGTATSVHSGAMAFTGIDQAAPVRNTAAASGAGTSSTIQLASAPGDLVANTVGQGNSITGPGAGQTERYLHNVSTSNTLNNSAGSTAPGASTVTMTWTFGASDEWQTISTSLRP